MHILYCLLHAFVHHAGIRWPGSIERLDSQQIVWCCVYLSLWWPHFFCCCCIFIYFNALDYFAKLCHTYMKWVYDLDCQHCIVNEACCVDDFAFMLCFNKWRTRGTCFFHYFLNDSSIMKGLFLHLIMQQHCVDFSGLAQSSWTFTKLFCIHLCFLAV